MKGTSRIVLAALVLLLAGVMPAQAHGHGHVGVFIGPVWGPTFWWGPGYYYPPRQTVVIERSPEVYTQQPPAPQSAGYWYYCRDANAYYPYVKDCPGGWKKVLPTPPEGGE